MTDLSKNLQNLKAYYWAMYKLDAKRPVTSRDAYRVMKQAKAGKLPKSSAAKWDLACEKVSAMARRMGVSDTPFALEYRYNQLLAEAGRMRDIGATGYD